MKKNLICVPFAYEDGKNTGGICLTPKDFTVKRMLKKYGYSIKNIYLMNACVALVSARQNNPQDDVALVTNLSSSEIFPQVLQIFRRENIKIFYISYDSFVFDKNYKWSLAFYKLCALKHVSDMGYQNICMLDSDVFVQGSFNPIWRDCQKNILLYDLSHGFNVEANYAFEKEIEAFTGFTDTFPTFYGGEFFAASTNKAHAFINECEHIYKKMCEQQFKTSYGDEFIVNVAALKSKDCIINAGRYIFRFWTRPSCRLISTAYKVAEQRLLILHLPAEKVSGFITVYENYIKKEKQLSDKKAWQIFRLEKLSIIERLKIGIAEFYDKKGKL